MKTVAELSKLSASNKIIYEFSKSVLPLLQVINANATLENLPSLYCLKSSVFLAPHCSFWHIVLTRIQATPPHEVTSL